jgi:hypothetical protein
MSACIFCIWRIIWLSCFWFAMLDCSARYVLVAVASSGFAPAVGKAAASATPRRQSW